MHTIDANHKNPKDSSVQVVPTIETELSPDVLQYHTFSGHPDVRHLVDLTRDAHVRQTSYLGEQNEVRDMVDHLREYRWPGFWYEFVQGAFDYNDVRKGPVQINIWLVGREMPLSYSEFLQSVHELGLQSMMVRAVTVENFISNNSGLRPRNIALTQHEEKLSDSTLGVHGRGMKIATTAALHGNLAQQVTFSSWTEEFGAWFGQARMADDPIDKTSPPFLQLDYKANKSISTEKTVVTVHMPSQEALESLVALQEWFLPLNASYALNKLPEKKQDEIVANRLTVYTSDKIAALDPSANVSAWNVGDLAQFNQLDLLRVRLDLNAEPPRTEILPSSIVLSPSPYDFVFVDGLRVTVPGAQFKFLYAFWGFGKGKSQGFNPKRSNDSLYLSQSAIPLIKELLLRNTDSEVYFEILADLIQSSPKYVEESLAGVRHHVFLKNSAAVEALRAAWLQVVQMRFETRVPKLYFIAESNSDVEYAESRNLAYIHIQSKSWASIIREVYPEIVSIERVRQEDNMRLLAQAEELLNQNKRLEEELRVNQEAQHRRYLEGRGITEEARGTGEVLKVTLTQKPELVLQSIKADLRLIAAKYAVATPTLDDSSALALRGEFTDGFIPVDTADIDVNLFRFIRYFVTVFGDQQTIELRISLSGKGVYFVFSRQSKRDDNGAYTLNVLRGEIQTGDKSEFSLTIQNVEKEGCEIIATITSLGDYLDSLMADFAAMSIDGRVRKELYEQLFAKELGISWAVLQARDEVTKEREKLQKYYDEINEHRKKAGLPLIINPFSKTTAVELEVATRGKKSQSTKTDAPAKEKTHNFARWYDPDDLDENDSPPEIIIDDVDIAEMTIQLAHPMAPLGLSTKGKSRPEWETAYLAGNDEQRAEIVRKLRRRYETAVESRTYPDFVLYSGSGEPLSGYLLSRLNPHFSEITLEQFQPLQQLPIKQLTGMPHIVFPKSLKPGLASLYCPPGYRPAAMFGPELQQQDVVVSGHLATQQYAMNLTRKIKGGLTIYFTPEPLVETRPPSEKSKKVIAEMDTLSGHWKELIRVVTESQLRDKRKLDLVLLAWVKAFTYDNSESTFDEYQMVQRLPNEFVSEIINKAIGDCGYAMRGLHGILSLVGLPCEEVGAFLANDAGEFSHRGSSHGLLKVYIDGSWVLIEPQRGYLQEGYYNELYECNGYSAQQRDSVTQARSIISSIEPSKYRNPQLQIRMLLKAPESEEAKRTSDKDTLDALWDKLNPEEIVDRPVQGGRRLDSVEVYHFGKDVDRLVQQEQNGVAVHDFSRAQRLRYDLLAMLEGFVRDNQTKSSLGAKAAEELFNYTVRDRLLKQDENNPTSQQTALRDETEDIVARSTLTELSESLPLWFRVARKMGVAVPTIVAAVAAANSASLLFQSMFGSTVATENPWSSLRDGWRVGVKNSVIHANPRNLTELSSTNPTLLPLALLAGFSVVTSLIQEVRIQRLQRELVRKDVQLASVEQTDKDAGIVIDIVESQHGKTIGFENNTSEILTSF